MRVVVVYVVLYNSKKKESRIDNLECVQDMKNLLEGEKDIDNGFYSNSSSNNDLEN